MNWVTNTDLPILLDVIVLHCAFRGAGSSVAEWSNLKSGDPEFRSRSVHQLDLFQVVPGSTPRLCLFIGNWSATC